MPAIQSTSPYGWTKVMIERILTDYCTAHPDFCAVLLRYFNPIGAHESGLLGDDPKAKELLGWEATHTEEDMCKSSWKFAQGSV